MQLTILQFRSTVAHRIMAGELRSNVPSIADDLPDPAAWNKRHGTTPYEVSSPLPDWIQRAENITREDLSTLSKERAVLCRVKLSELLDEITAFLGMVDSAELFWDAKERKFFVYPYNPNA